ncbi:MBL fold metallo-hydrolase [Ancylomarina euxinus]|uniref:MBL fold metallo-hydrolase n=1 Tax=Ancylomarina euxinus TaxID=2283627 RepID=A0A425Y774_9BACT|nr:MBL fold metallo-hydrolase [Ancylomarina euxinus]MCZ4693910.1 MBL fold metallo-hydrolase [Ancylomarina euxinus]MUP14669.1 MBL fold metallo-hydrolase [Ancylomarina euxinus]RRG24215.1 MBL fold metallo-hydrolase [Ancylomarina euxinus]
MKLTFLGTGTSQGIPIIACKCPVCLSTDKKDKRLRTSAMVEVDGQNIVIDSGPDFRYQMLRAQIEKLDAILFTHEHKDHTAGLDDVRAFNWVNKKAVDIYAEERVQASLKQEFAYVFAEFRYPGIPQLKLWTVENKTFYINGTEIVPIRAKHFKLPVYGYRIDGLAYITDANYISDKEKEKLQGLKVLVLNALRKEKHLSHFTLAEALALIEELKPEKAYLTHFSHQLGFHEEISKELPENVFMAYDGLKIEIY